MKTLLILIAALVVVNPSYAAKAKKPAPAAKVAAPAAQPVTEMETTQTTTTTTTTEVSRPAAPVRPQAAPARAQYQRSSDEDLSLGSRETHRFGVTVGLLTDPIPSMFGFNVGYNVTDFFRLQGGIGFISISESIYTLSTTNFTGEAQVFVPNLNFSPVGLIGVGYLTGTISGAIDDTKTAGISSSSAYFFLGAGLDWQTYLGFTLQLHYKIVIANGGSQGIPGLAIGWYF